MEGEPGAVDQERILDLLVRADVFEQVLQQRYLGTKRFSLEGNTALLPLVDEILDSAAQRGAINLVMNERKKQPAKSPPQVKTEKAPVIFNGKPQSASIYERDQMTAGKKYSGPAIITEYSATTVIPPKASFFIDEAGNLQIH